MADHRAHIAEEVLAAYVDDPQSVDDRSAVEEHLAACPACRTTADDLRALVAAMRERLDPAGVSVYAPAPRLATDNAAMIARAGLFHFERGVRDSLNLNAYAAIDIPGIVSLTTPSP